MATNGVGEQDEMRWNTLIQCLFIIARCIPLLGKLF